VQSEPAGPPCSAGCDASRRGGVSRKRLWGWHHETDSISAGDREQRTTDRLCLGSTIRDFAAEPALEPVVRM
jgi:hypothetical protein